MNKANSTHLTHQKPFLSSQETIGPNSNPPNRVKAARPLAFAFIDAIQETDEGFVYAILDEVHRTGVQEEFSYQIYSQLPPSEANRLFGWDAFDLEKIVPRLLQDRMSGYELEKAKTTYEKGKNAWKPNFFYAEWGGLIRHFDWSDRSRQISVGAGVLVFGGLALFAWKTFVFAVAATTVIAIGEGVSHLLDSTLDLAFSKKQVEKVASLESMGEAGGTLLLSAPGIPAIIKVGRTIRTAELARQELSGFILPKDPRHAIPLEEAIPVEKLSQIGIPSIGEGKTLRINPPDTSPSFIPTGTATEILDPLLEFQEPLPLAAGAEQMGTGDLLSSLPASDTSPMILGKYKFTPSPSRRLMRMMGGEARSDSAFPSQIAANDNGLFQAEHFLPPPIDLKMPPIPLTFVPIWDNNKQKYLDFVTIHNQELWQQYWEMKLLGSAANAVKMSAGSSENGQDPISFTEDELLYLTRLGVRKLQLLPSGEIQIIIDQQIQDPTVVHSIRMVVQRMIASKSQATPLPALHATVSYRAGNIVEEEVLKLSQQATMSDGSSPPVFNLKAIGEETPPSTSVLSLGEGAADNIYNLLQARNFLPSSSNAPHIIAVDAAFLAKTSDGRWTSPIPRNAFVLNPDMQASGRGFAFIDERQLALEEHYVHGIFQTLDLRDRSGKRIKFKVIFSLSSLGYLLMSLYRKEGMNGVQSTFEHILDHLAPEGTLFVYPIMNKSRLTVQDPLLREQTGHFLDKLNLELEKMIKSLMSRGVIKTYNLDFKESGLLILTSP